jgi:hypothetical protein
LFDNKKFFFFHVNKTYKKIEKKNLGTKSVNKVLIVNLRWRIFNVMCDENK